MSGAVFGKHLKNISLPKKVFNMKDCSGAIDITEESIYGLKENTRFLIPGAVSWETFTFTISMFEEAIVKSADPNGLSILMPCIGLVKVCVVK